jgi:EAL domain-containing protein (putative c-di-GMP-specific phosphodiesterase class I)
MIDEIQGYYFSKPLSVHEVAGILRADLALPAKLGA